MLNTENLPVFFTICLVLGAPIFLFFRNRMTDGRKKPVKRTRERVLRITSIHLLIIFWIYCMVFLFYLSIVGSNFIFNSLTASMTILLIFSVSLIFYGGGIYVTSILLEDFTLPNVRDIPNFKTQFIATHLFHGPVSHILMCVGSYYSVFTLSLLDLMYSKTHSTQLNQNVILGLGIICGLAFSYAQIANRTFLFQILPISLCLILYVYVLLSGYAAFIYNAPLALYFLGSSIATPTVFFIHMLYEKFVKNEKGA